MDEEDELDEKIYTTLCKDIGQEKNLTSLPSIFSWTPSVSFHRFEERVKMTQITESEFCKENYTML